MTQARTMQAPAVIVGGGIVGCAAYYLARRGVQAVLLEKSIIGAEASGRNASIVPLTASPTLSWPPGPPAAPELPCCPTPKRLGSRFRAGKWWRPRRGDEQENSRLRRVSEWVVDGEPSMSLDEPSLSRFDQH